MNINPNAVVLVAFCATVGALFNHTLLGLAIGLGIVLSTEFWGQG